MSFCYTFAWWHLFLAVPVAAIVAYCCLFVFILFYYWGR